MACALSLTVAAAKAVDGRVAHGVPGGIGVDKGVVAGGHRP